MVEDLVVFENTTTSIIKVDANLKTDPKKHNSKNKNCLEGSCKVRSPFDKCKIWGYPRKSSKKIEVARN